MCLFGGGQLWRGIEEALGVVEQCDGFRLRTQVRVGCRGRGRGRGREGREESVDGRVVQKRLDGFIVVFRPWRGDILVIIRFAYVSKTCRNESMRRERLHEGQPQPMAAARSQM